MVYIYIIYHIYFTTLAEAKRNSSTSFEGEKEREREGTGHMPIYMTETKPAETEREYSIQFT